MGYYQNPQQYFYQAPADGSHPAADQTYNPNAMYEIFSSTKKTSESNQTPHYSQVNPTQNPVYANNLPEPNPVFGGAQWEITEKKAHYSDLTGPPPPTSSAVAQPTPEVVKFESGVTQSTELNTKSRIFVPKSK